MCSSKDVITGVFWYDTSTEQVPTSQCESEYKFLHLSLLLSIHAMQIHAHAPVGMSNKPLLVWSFCCCLLFCFFLKKVALPASEHKHKRVLEIPQELDAGRIFFEQTCIWEQVEAGMSYLK